MLPWKLIEKFSCKLNKKLISVPDFQNRLLSSKMALKMCKIWCWNLRLEMLLWKLRIYFLKVEPTDFILVFFTETLLRDEPIQILNNKKLDFFLIFEFHKTFSRFFVLVSRIVRLYSSHFWIVFQNLNGIKSLFLNVKPIFWEKLIFEIISHDF